MPHGFAYMDKDLLHRHITNSGNWILMVGTYLHNGCKDRDYFLHLKKIGTNLQKGPKVRDQNAYLLQIQSYHSPIFFVSYFHAGLSDVSLFSPIS